MSRSHHRTGLARTIAIAAASGAMAFTASAQFVPNELYLASTLLPATGTPCGRPGVVRINTSTWQSTLVAYAGDHFAGRMAYAPSRGALLLMNDDSTVDMLYSNGLIQPLPAAGANNLTCIAPTADGRIYFWGPATHQVRYYDSTNAIHTLMDLGGAAPYQYPITADAMFYDAATNSLFFSSHTAQDLTQVTKVPLNAAGTSLSSAVTVVSFDASPGFNSEICVGFSKGPGGKLFLAIDDNGGGDIGRMQTVDPVTMQAAVFATSNYSGVGAEVAGAYDPALNMALMYDPFNSKLRGYLLGGHGEGNQVSVAGIVGPCFAGTPSQIVVIDVPSAPPALSADVGGPGGLSGPDGHLDNNDFIVFINWYFAGDARADRGAAGGVAGSDGHFDNNDFIAFINQFFAGH